MTTAHRPTFAPKRGSADNAPGKYFVPTISFSSRDLPGHLTLKYLEKPLQKTKQQFANQLLRKQASQPKRQVDMAFHQLQPAVRKMIQKPINQTEDVEEDPDDLQFIKQQEEQQQDQHDLLMRQYERIRRQREQDEKRRIKERQAMLQANAKAFLLKGRPISQQYSLQKKWYQDTPFRNQAKAKVQVKQYVNDNVRSQFHRKFINRFVMR